MKLSLFLITLLSFLTSPTFAQRKSLFQQDSTLNNLSVVKIGKPLNQDMLGKSNGMTSNFPNRLKKDSPKFMFKDSQNSTVLEKDNEFVSGMPVIEPKGNYPMRMVPIDSTIQYSLLIVKLH